MVEALAKISEASKLFMEKGLTFETATHALSLVGSVLRVGRAYVFENRSVLVRGKLLTDVRYMWCASGVASPLDNASLQALCLGDAAPAWLAELEKGSVVASLVKAAPAKLRTVLDMQRSQSVLLAPIMPTKDWWGFIVLDDLQGARAWSAEELIIAKALARAFGGAIRHRQMRSSLAQARNQLSEAMVRCAAITG